MNEKEHDEHLSPQDAPTSPPENDGRAPAQKQRRLLRLAAWSVAGAFGFLVAAGGGGLLFLHSSAGEAWLTRTINGALQSLPGGLSASINGVQGPLPFRFQASGIRVCDEQGVWLEAESAELSMNWSELPKTLAVAEISLNAPRMLRLPETTPTAEEDAPQTPLSVQQMQEKARALFQDWPGWLPAFQVQRLSIRRAELSEAVFGHAVQASLEAAARIGSGGVSASLKLSRDDEACEPVVVQAELSSEISLDLDAQGSDLGFLDFLPKGAGDAIGTFHLTGKGKPSQLRASLWADLQEKDSLRTALSASADAVLNLMEPDAETMLRSALVTLESGPASERLWTLAGQKNGSLKAGVLVQTRQNVQPKLEVYASAEFADMVWATPELAALFGKACTLRGSGAMARSDEHGLSAEITSLNLTSERLRALVQGALRLPDGSLESPRSDMKMHAECAFNNAGALIPQLSGNARFSGDVSGSLSALSAKLSLSSDRLRIDKTLLEKAQVELTLPHADIPHMAAELPRLAELGRQGLFGDGTNEHYPDSTAQASENAEAEKETSADAPLPLLTGRARADLRINGQKTSLDTLWTVEEQRRTPSLRVSLDKLDLRLEDNAATGTLAALIPFDSSLRPSGTVAEFLGMTPPALDGSLNIRIPHWTPLARISGLNIAGSPLTMELSLSSSGSQSVAWKGTLDRLRIRSSQSRVALSGLNGRMNVKHLWAKPDVDVDAGLKTLKTPSLSLSGLSLTAQGSQSSLRAALQSRGDIRCDAALRWKPGEYTLEKLDVDMVPALLGLSGDETAGLRLVSPTTLRRKGDMFSLSGASFDLLPSGSIDVSGSWSPNKLSLNADLALPDLAAFRCFSQELPSGSLDLNAAVAGTLSRPTGNFKLNLKKILLPGSTMPPVDADVVGRLGVSGKRRTLSVSLELPKKTQQELGLTSCVVQANLPFTSPTHGAAAPDLRGPLRGEVLISGELGRIWQLLPLADQRLSGVIDLTADLSGTLSAPELTLHAELDNGRFAELVQGIELRNIRLRADADRMNVVRKSGGRLTLDLSAEDGRKGRVTLNGWFDPRDLALSINGNIDKLSPLRRQDISIMLSGSLGVSGTANDPSVRADITVDKGQIQLADLPGGDIVTLPIEQPGQKARPPAPPLKGRLNVHVRIPNQFFIRGYGLECEWKGDISARGPLARPGVTGNVQAVRGGLDVLGKHFNLTEGRISFDGGWPVSPMLNIVMEYTAPSITADVTVSGPATKPEIALSSQPAMPQDEIISQIMFGQSAGTLSHVQALQLAAGAAQLAGLGGPDVMGFGRKLLGLDVFKLNSDNASSDAGNSDMSKTSLEMGTYVLDNVYVGVDQGIGRDSDTGAVVEIELTPSLEAQAKASSNKTEFGLEWKKNY